MLSGRQPVADGEAGITQIVGRLNALKDLYGAQPAVRSVAVRIAGGFVNDDDTGNAQRLAAFVRRSLVYVKDPLDAEFIQTPDVLLLEILSPRGRGRAFGDCDDHALLFASLAQAVGIPAEIVAVKMPPSPTFNHVIVVVQIDGQPIDIDLCAKDGFQPGYGEKLFA